MAVSPESSTDPRAGQWRVRQQSLWSVEESGDGGRGIARLPSYMVHAEVNDGRLHWLFRDYQTSVLPLFLVHPYEGELPKRIQVLADYLLGWFQRSTDALERLATLEIKNGP